MTTREESKTWAIMKYIAAQWPRGVWSREFKPQHTPVEVQNCLDYQIKRGLAGMTKSGKYNIYTVSPEQYVEYLKPVPMVLSAKAMSVKGDGSIFGTIFELADRDCGVSVNDVVCNLNRYQLACKLARLYAEKRIYRVRMPAYSQYFMTQEQANKFSEQIETRVVEKAQRTYPKRAKAAPASFRYTAARKRGHEHTKEASRAEWNRTPMHIPPGVEIQYAPKPRGRYEVSEPIVGGFVSEWRALRA